MTKAKGIDFLVMVNTGTDELPVYTQIAGQRGATLNRSQELIDSTSKGSTSKENEIGFKEWSIESDGLFVVDDVAFGALEDAFMTGEKVKVQLATPNGTKYEGMAIITDLPLEVPYDDMATWSVSLTGDGELSKITA
jgi:TP901-1 family phage major tail protein